MRRSRSPVRSPRSVIDCEAKEGVLFVFVDKLLLGRGSAIQSCFSKPVLHRVVGDCYAHCLWDFMRDWKGLTVTAARRSWFCSSFVKREHALRGASHIRPSFQKAWIMQLTISSRLLVISATGRCEYSFRERVAISHLSLSRTLATTEQFLNPFWRAIFIGRNGSIIMKGSCLRFSTFLRKKCVQWLLLYSHGHVTSKN